MTYTFWSVVTTPTQTAELAINSPATQTAIFGALNVHRGRISHVQYKHVQMQMIMKEILMKVGLKMLQMKLIVINIVIVVQGL